MLHVKVWSDSQAYTLAALDMVHRLLLASGKENSGDVVPRSTNICVKLDMFC